MQRVIYYVWAVLISMGGEACLAGTGFSRKLDPIIVRGDRIPSLNGIPTARIRLYRIGDAGAAPVPFQIDERDAGGALSLTGAGGAPVDPDDGKWDGNDELVFMARDCGARGGRGSLPPECAAVAEIACSDPLTGSTGWVYCAALPAPPREDPCRYVRYDSARDRVDADSYELGYAPGGRKAYFSTLVLKNGPNGPSADILDRFKFRVRLALFFSLFSLDRSEDEMRSELAGWKDGPVRAIRRCRNSMGILFGIQSPASVVDNFYYRDSFEWPTLISLPFNVSTIASEGMLTTGCDWSQAACGMSYRNACNASPVIVDGTMSREEREMDRGFYAWSALFGPQGALITRLWLSPSLVMGKELLYVDDRCAEDPPEEGKGSWGYNGYRFDISSVSKGTHRFVSYFYFPEGYAPGGEKSCLDVLDRPISVRAVPL